MGNEGKEPLCRSTHLNLFVKNLKIKTLLCRAGLPKHDLLSREGEVR